jgi:glycosyltransferase involved in cell wall biosynthesis
MWPTHAAPGTGAFVRAEVEALKRRGLDVVVIADCGPKAITAYPRLWRELRRFLKNHAVGVVHAHYGLTGWVARAQTAAPVVVTFHGTDLLGSRRMRAGVKARAGRFEQLTSRILARVIALPNAVSPKMLSLLPSNATLIPAGIDEHIFRTQDKAEARDALRLSPDERIVLFVANPRHTGKQYWLAEAAVSELQAAGSQASLRVVQGVPPVDVALWMAAADALLITSQSEGSPCVVREALACGLPVVSVDVGDVRSRLEAVPGCIITNSDPAAIADALRRVLQADRRVAASKEVIWTSDAAARELVKAYEAVMASAARCTRSPASP